MKKAISILLFFSSLLLLQSCGYRISTKSSINVPQTSHRSIEDGNIKVAFVVPLSGKDAQVGRSLLDAAQMAIHDGNIHGITLYPVDSQSRNSVGSMRDKEVHMVVGPLFSDDTMMVYNMSNNDGVPVLSFSNDSSLSGKSGLYLLGISVTDQVNSLLSFAESRGYKNIFTVTSQDRYGDMVEDAAKNFGGTNFVKSYNYNNRDNVIGFGHIVSDIYSKAGIDINLEDLEQEADEDSNSLNVSLKKRVETEYVILFPASDSKLLEFAKTMQLHSSDYYHIPILGSIQWDDPKIYRSYSNLLSGSYFPSVRRRKFEQFQKKFRNNFGYQPAVIAALGYDSINMIAQIVESLKAGGNSYVDYGVIQSQTFSDMITGIIGINTDGTMRRKLTVHKID